MNGTRPPQHDINTDLEVAPRDVTVPHPAVTTITRRRLHDALDDFTAPVTLVIAGAGYGKTTLLSMWADTLACPVAWLSLDTGDNDSIRLLRGIVAGLADIGDTAELLQIGREARPASIDRALSALERTLRHVGPFVVIVDDVHLIDDEAAADVLDALIDAVPAGSRVVFAGRTEPHIRTGRRLLDGQLGHLDVLDLQFTSDEALALLSELSTAEPEVLQSLVAQLDGWAAGLRFMALALGRSPDAQDLARASDRRNLLAKYFQQEFLVSLSPSEREFLARTSMLEHLSGALCDHVLDRSGSAEHLETLVASGNAFVTPIGNSGQFRYHASFAAILLDELRRTTPELEPELRNRAIQWYEQHGEWGAAVRTALDSNGLVAASPLILRYLVSRISVGEISSIGGWLDHYDHDELASDPLLCISAAWHALFANRPRDVGRWLALAERQTHDGPLPDGTRDLPTAVAAVRMLAGANGARRTAEDARLIRDAAPDGGPWSPVAGLLETVALASIGDVEDIRERFEQAEFETRGFHAAHVVALGHLALDSLERRHIARANRELRAALDEVDEYGLANLTQVTVVFCVESILTARAGAHAESLAAAERAVELMLAADVVNDRAHIFLSLILADAAVLRGDWDEASRLVDQVAQWLPREPDAAVLHARWARLKTRCDTKSRLGHLVELTTAERNVLEELATHRTLAEIGKHLYVSRNTVKTHTVSIYRKLYVSSRGEAVDRAIELGLLDDSNDAARRSANGMG